MTTWDIKQGDIDRIVSMTAAEWAAEERRLQAASDAAYANYTGVMPRPVAGTPQAAGHGTVIGGFSGQREWDEASSRLDVYRRIRAGTQWVRTGVGAEVTYRFSSGHAVTIPTHGVDVSECRTPAEAIARVRTACGVAA